jgi:hypothetical protein
MTRRNRPRAACLCGLDRAVARGGPDKQPDGLRPSRELVGNGSASTPMPTAPGRFSATTTTFLPVIRTVGAAGSSSRLERRRLRVRARCAAGCDTANSDHAIIVLMFIGPDRPPDSVDALTLDSAGPGPNRTLVRRQPGGARWAQSPISDKAVLSYDLQNRK